VKKSGGTPRVLPELMAERGRWARGDGLAKNGKKGSTPDVSNCVKGNQKKGLSKDFVGKQFVALNRQKNEEKKRAAESHTHLL